MRPLLLTLILLLPLAGCVDVPDDGAPASSAGERPRVGVSLEHDYAMGETRTEGFVIPEGAGPMRFEAYIAQCTQTGGLALTVRDPSGAVFAEVGGSHTVVSVASSCSGRSEDGIRLAPGNWTVTFSGQGVGTGVLFIEG